MRKEDRRREPILSRSEGSAGSGAGRAKKARVTFAEAFDALHLDKLQSELSNPQAPRAVGDPPPRQFCNTLSLRRSRSEQVCDRRCAGHPSPIWTTKTRRDEGVRQRENAFWTGLLQWVTGTARTRLSEKVTLQRCLPTASRVKKVVNLILPVAFDDVSRWFTLPAD